MRGTWQTEGGGDAARVVLGLAAIAAAAAAAEWVLSMIWAILAILAVIATGLGAGAVWMYRKYGRAPEVLPWRAQQAIPDRRSGPIAARTVQALPAPQHVHYHLHLEQSAITERRQP